jgi:hypothetical protein
MKVIRYLLLYCAIFSALLFFLGMYLWQRSYVYIDSYSYVTSSDISPQHLYGVSSCDGKLSLTWNQWVKPTKIAWMPDASGHTNLGRYEGLIHNSSIITVHSEWGYFTPSYEGISLLGTVIEREEEPSHTFCRIEIPYSYSILFSGLSLLFAHLFGNRRRNPSTPNQGAQRGDRRE